MKRFLTLTLFVLIFLNTAVSYAQPAVSYAQPAVSYAQHNAYIIPRIVYVGDPAVLILPLPNVTTKTASSVSLDTASVHFPKDINIDFHRVVLEHTASGSRLIIEFTAFAPGLHSLPAIEIAGERFTGLSVTVNSVVDSRYAPSLSGPASSLAMPGTALMLYGTIAGLVFGLLAALWFTLKGRRYLHGWSEKFKRWQLFVSMRSTEKRLHKAMLRGENKRAVLDVLSDKFRIFLTFFTGCNCRAMTAREFEKTAFRGKMPENDSLFLGNFFRRCDELRFSGADIGQDDIFGLLDDLRMYLVQMENIKSEELTA